jgi:hypothetical protein
MKIPKNKLIKLYWKDHYFQSEWNTIKDIEKTAENGFKEMCWTYGYCLVNKPGYIVMSSSFNGDDEYGNTAMILKKDIVNFKIIKDEETKRKG